MVFDEIRFDRTEGAYSDVEGEKGVIDHGEHFGSKVEPGGGGCDRSFFAGEGGLVAVAVGAVAFSIHIMGEGELAVSFFIDFTIPADDPVAIFEHGFDGARCFADLDGAAWFHFFARADEAFPFERGEFVGADEFYFVIVGEKPGRRDFGVVEDEEIIG